MGVFASPGERGIRISRGASLQLHLFRNLRRLGKLEVLIRLLTSNKHVSEGNFPPTPVLPTPISAWELVEQLPISTSATSWESFNQVLGLVFPRPLFLVVTWLTRQKCRIGNDPDPVGCGHVNAGQDQPCKNSQMEFAHPTTNHMPPIIPGQAYGNMTIIHPICCDEKVLRKLPLMHTPNPQHYPNQLFTHPFFLIKIQQSIFLKTDFPLLAQCLQFPWNETFRALNPHTRHFLGFGMDVADQTGRHGGCFTIPQSLYNYLLTDEKYIYGFFMLGVFWDGFRDIWFGIKQRKWALKSSTVGSLENKGFWIAQGKVDKDFKKSFTPENFTNNPSISHTA
ncbi:hypothetical protein VP01_2729g1 [Puccinia sorghi]|uniref:Uncharacterized protein n=1 Tax=Puccinia sorghi TaxID=27349 RepID=A0A0L6V3C0_9BASI|nr:hypothetical protein VP01_2729g1 [Puccinia sorghi]